jgi:hypothetical protein
MVREGVPPTSLFATEKDVDADRSLCPDLDPGIGMTGGPADQHVAGRRSKIRGGSNPLPNKEAISSN